VPAEPNQSWWTRDRQVLVGILLLLSAPFLSALISVSAGGAGIRSVVPYWSAIVVIAVIGNMMIWRNVWLRTLGVLVTGAATGFVGIFVTLIFGCAVSTRYCI
jgi:hypothetical protein